jgi:hypothetical protein
MFQDAVSERFGAMRGLSTDDVLSALGLQRRRSFAASIAPIASGFAAGALAGAAVALLFAPKAGREMRRELKGRASEVTRRVGAAADEVMNEVRNALPRGEKEEEVSSPPRPASLQENGERRPFEQPHAGSRMSPPPK